MVRSETDSQPASWRAVVSRRPRRYWAIWNRRSARRMAYSINENRMMLAAVRRILTNSIPTSAASSVRPVQTISAASYAGMQRDQITVAVGEMDDGGAHVIGRYGIRQQCHLMRIGKQLFGQPCTEQPFVDAHGEQRVCRRNG